MRSNRFFQGVSKVQKQQQSKFKNQAVDMDDEEFSLNSGSMKVESEVHKSGRTSSKSLEEMVKDINKSIKNEAQEFQFSHQKLQEKQPLIKNFNHNYINSRFAGNINENDGDYSDMTRSVGK